MLRAALGWLVNDYHQTIVDGKTRQEWFLSTAPAGSRVQYDFGDLNIIMSERLERTVSGNGTVRYRNAEWGMKNAGLIRYQGQKVVLLVSHMMVTETIRAAVVVGDQLSILGTLEPMRWAALSEESREYRKAAKAELREIQAVAEQYKAAYTDPMVRADNVFTANLPTAKTLNLAAPPTARLETQPADPAALEQQAAIQALVNEGFRFDDDVELEL
ncbi:MAG: hypothetical protein HC933_03865 [Pleurocapsa sp. SU_196_0]|nr:hypothetical protein [Pleurocapsa sp. SU_196_0]